MTSLSLLHHLVITSLQSLHNVHLLDDDEVAAAAAWLFFSAFISLVRIFLSWPPGLGRLVFCSDSFLLRCFPSDHHQYQPPLTPHPSYLRARCRWSCPGRSCSVRTHRSVPEQYYIWEVLLRNICWNTSDIVEVDLCSVGDSRCNCALQTGRR